MCPDLKLFSLFLSSSCISEFFDAQSYGTDDGVASEYSSDEEIVSDNEDNEGTLLIQYIHISPHNLTDNNTCDACEIRTQ